MSSIARILANDESGNGESSALEASAPAPIQETSQQNHHNQQQQQQQRKRSKVSRACDECRRKKIKCDAVFSSTSNTVVKACSSCVKNKDNCSFERVPLKRGPTKGYVKTDPSNELRESARSESSRSTGSSMTSTMQGQLTQPFTSPQNQSQGQLQQGITLPPFTAITSVPLRVYPGSQPSVPIIQPSHSTHASQPSSPGRASPTENVNIRPTTSATSIPSLTTQNQATTQIPQGLFWKVPYQGPLGRRGSVDSVSSVYESPRFNFAPRSISYESSVISDSDDDAVRSSARNSPRNSIDLRNRSRSDSDNLQPPLSPAVSISSLQSLNLGLSKNLTLNSNNQISAIEIQQRHQLINLYYQFIHLTFPILPLNKQSLNNLLSIPAPLQPNDTQVLEINNVIVVSFFNSLDILINTVSRGPLNGTIAATTNSMFDPLNQLFQTLFTITNKIQENHNHLSQNITILLTCSLVMLSYCVVLLGIEFDINIASSIAILNNLKVFRLFWDNSHVITPENYDDYNSLLKRLYVELDILDTLQSLSFGSPKICNIQFDFNIIESLFPQNCGIGLLSNSKISQNNLKFGMILSKLSHLRNFQSTTFNYPKSLIVELKNSNTNNFLIDKSSEQDQLTSNLLDFVVSKYELIEYLDEISKNFSLDNLNGSNFDEDLFLDHQSKISRIIKKFLSRQSILLSTIKNYSNSIDYNNPNLISPYIPIIFRQLIKMVNLSKIIINSLQLNQDLLSRLSKPMNELISLNNYLSLLKPYKIEENNTHLDFKFYSTYLHFFENDSIDDKKITGFDKYFNWIGLIFDIKKFIENDDYNGWF